MKGEVAVITLNRQEKRNVVNTAMRDGVLSPGNASTAIRGPRGGLTAAGRQGFCAGATSRGASGRAWLIPILRDEISSPSR